jgi:WD40 repeat protein
LAVPLLVFGHKKVAILVYDSVARRCLAPCFLLACEDLVSDARTLKDDGSSASPMHASTNNISYLVAIGYAHNNVELWSCDDLGASQRMLRVESQVRCLLYSMKLYGETISDLVVGSGTIFNQIVIWDPLGDGSLAQSIEGHQGVLFSVQFSNDGKCLCTTSDDRTLRLWRRQGQAHSKIDMLACKYAPVWTAFGHTARVWDCVFAPSLKNHNGDEGIISVAEDGTCRMWDGTTGSEVAILRGHVLKNVWSCALDLTGRIVVTGGGDSAIKLWDIEKQTRQRLSSSLSSSSSSTSWIELPSSSKRINSMISNSKGSIAYVATANGTLLSCDLNASGSSIAASSMSSSVTHTSSNTVQYIYGPVHHNDQKERSLPLCTLSLSKNEDHLAAGDTVGMCHVLQLNAPPGSDSQPLLWQAHEYRCWRVQWVYGRQTAQQPSWSSSLKNPQNINNDGLLFTFGAEGSLKMWDVSYIWNTTERGSPKLLCVSSVSQLTTASSDALHLAERKERSNKRAKTRKFSATFSCAHYSNGIVYAGDNRGGISLWSPNGSEHATLLWYESSVHGHDKVQWLGNGPSSGGVKGDNPDVFSAGHDGRVMRHTLVMPPSSSPSSSLACRLQMSQLYKCGAITAAESVSWTQDGHMLVVGFLAKDMIVYDITAQYQISRVQCGGWRRPYDVHFSGMPKYAHAGRMMSIYVPTKTSRSEKMSHSSTGGGSKGGGCTKQQKHSKSSDIILEVDVSGIPHDDTTNVGDVGRSSKQPLLFNNHSLHTNYHGRMSTAVRFVPSSRTERFIVTGGEDNAVKLLMYLDGQVQCLDSSEVHTSAVRALFVIPSSLDGDHVASNTSIIFSAGGNNQLSFWTVDTSAGPRACLQLVTSHKQHAVVLNNQQTEDDDCRYMSLSAVVCTDAASSGIITMCGSSQGTVSLYLCNQQAVNAIQHLHTFHLPGMGRKPLLSMSSVGHKDVGHLCVTGSTDGTIAIWDITWAVKCLSAPDMMRPLIVLSRHSMGVNAISTHLLTTTTDEGKMTFCVATGGDDNALACSILEYSVATGGKIKECVPYVTASTAAASAIRSVWTDGQSVVATGWDQRLSVWNVREESKITYTTSAFVHVADCAALDIAVGSKSWDIVVAGQGLEIRTLQNMVFTT